MESISERQLKIRISSKVQKTKCFTLRSQWKVQVPKVPTVFPTRSKDKVAGTCNNKCIRKYLSDEFAVHIGLKKQGEAATLLLTIVALENSIW
jgi:hypothetical protein